MVAQKLKVRYVVVMMVFFGVMVSFMMRVNINLAIVAMVNHTAIPRTNISRSDECGHVNSSVDLHSLPDDHREHQQLDGPFAWNERVIGFVLGSFYYGYIFTQLPGGRMAELMNSKHVYGLSVLLTGLLTILTPLAANWSWQALVTLRAVMGLVLGVSYPASFVLMGAWVPPAEMNFMIMLSQGGGDLGNTFTLPLSSAIITSIGWEAVFYIQGAVVLLWFIMWMVLVHPTPDAHPFISSEERDLIKKSIGARLSVNPPPLPWRKMFTSMPVWAFFISLFSANWCYYNLLNDLPQYVNNILGEDLATNALLNSMPYAGLWLCSIIFGWVCDWMLKKGWVRVWTVRQMASASTQLFTAIILVWIAFVGCHATLVKVLLVITIILQGGGYGLDCQALDLAPNYAGTISGLANTFGAAPGFLAPLVVAELTVGHETIARWQIVFLIGAGISLVGWFIFLFCSSVEEQDWNRGDEVGVEHLSTATHLGPVPATKTQDQTANFDRI